MNGPAHFHPADWGKTIDDVCTSAGTALFKAADLVWCVPRLWAKGRSAPVTKADIESVYAIVRDHKKSQRKYAIEYIGLTTSPKVRFNNHPTARAIVRQRGVVKISFASVSFIKGRNKIENRRRALEEIEHLLIWAVGPRHNISKNYTLPGMGKQRANAWHIINSGYRFAGQMPREIVFPWMIVKLGRDRSKRATA